MLSEIGIQVRCEELFYRFNYRHTVEKLFEIYNLAVFNPPDQRNARP